MRRLFVPTAAPTTPGRAPEVADGYVWGRGTIDMKHMAAMSVVVLGLLARHDVPLRRDVVFAAVADEEAGCGQGSAWLVAAHPDLVRAEFALGEVRGFTMHVGADVLEGFGPGAAQKSKTNIFAHGFSESRAVSFGASRKGRVWSHEQARDIHGWVRWASQVGPTITDNSISLESVMSGFLLPEPARQRPVAEAVRLGHER
jgi:acetylornithine deacetylase/succinyl-diaminopimelate desuccinylase-like protein